MTRSRDFFFKKKIEINIRLNTCTRRAMQDCRVWESPIFLFLFTIARHQWEHQNAYFSLCVHFALALFHSLSLIPSHCDFANEYMILILWELRQSIELNHHSHKHIRRNVLFQISLHWNYVVVFSFSFFFYIVILDYFMLSLSFHTFWINKNAYKNTSGFLKLWLWFVKGDPVWRNVFNFLEFFWTVVWCVHSVK